MRYVAGRRAFDERGLLPQVVEQPVGVGPVGQLGGERSRQRGAHADQPQEVLRVRAQAVEDLAGQVLGDRALVARELGEEGDGIVGAAQRERGEPEPGCPAVGPGLQDGHLRRGQREAGGRQQGGGVVER